MSSGSRPVPQEGQTDSSCPRSGDWQIVANGHDDLDRVVNSDVFPIDLIAERDEVVHLRIVLSFITNAFETNNTNKP